MVRNVLPLLGWVLANEVGELPRTRHLLVSPAVSGLFFVN
jgi:hypothetical protein